METPQTTAVKAEAPSGENKSSFPLEKPLKHMLLESWIKSFAPVTMSFLALLVSVLSLLFTLGYFHPREEHDVVAKVLSTPWTAIGGTNDDDGLSIDLALINRGNQTEIIRDAFACYSETKDFKIRMRSSPTKSPLLNLQLQRGEKRVLRLRAPSGFIGKKLWLGVSVRAIAPNAEDVVSIWPVIGVELAPDGGKFGDHKETPLIQVISNKRLPHQQPAPILQ